MKHVFNIGTHLILAVAKTDQFSKGYSLTNIWLGCVFPFAMLLLLNGMIAVAILKHKKVLLSCKWQYIVLSILIHL